MEKVNDDFRFFVRKTDPKYTKKVKIGGSRAFTNIDSYYLIQEATKVFGLFGKGWGIRDVKWEHITIKDTVIAKLEAVFFIPEGEFKITNSGKLYYLSNQGKDMLDTDIYKKIETNTISKALSRIGFGTDIFLGKFEDVDYTSDLLEDIQLCNPETLQVLRNELQKNNVSADLVTKHFMIRALKDLMYKDFNEAVAIIRANSKNK